MLARTSSIRAGRPVPSRHLHRQSTGALTSRAAFTPTTPHLRSRLVAQVKVALSEVQASMRSDRRPSSDNGSRMHGRATLCGKGRGKCRHHERERARAPASLLLLVRCDGRLERTVALPTLCRRATGSSDLGSSFARNATSVRGTRSSSRIASAVSGCSMCTAGSGRSIPRRAPRRRDPPRRGGISP